MCAYSQVSVECQLESLNRARDFFGNPAQRHQDWLNLIGQVKIENYRRGRIALILDCQRTAVSVSQSNAAGVVAVNRGAVVDSSTFLVLKADVQEAHHLEHWNKQLVLVSDVQTVQSPEGVIPSLVGLYRSDYQAMNPFRNLLLCESAIRGGLKFLPCVSDWKLCRSIGDPIASKDASMVQNVQCASQVVQNIANNQCSIDTEGPNVEINYKKVCSHLCVFLDGNAIEIRAGDFGKQRIKIVDVLCGPLNFFA